MKLKDKQSRDIQIIGDSINQKHNFDMKLILYMYFFYNTLFRYILQKNKSDLFMKSILEKSSWKVKINIIKIYLIFLFIILVTIRGDRGIIDEPKRNMRNDQGEH